MLIFFNAATSTCEIEFYEKDSFHVRFSFSYLSTGSFYNKDGRMISWRTDPDRELNPDYTFELSDLRLEGYFEYFFTDDASAYLQIPLSYNKLSELFINDTNSTEERESRGSFSLFQPSYYALGGKYRFSDDKLKPYAQVEFRIPPGFHDGILDDPDYSFLSDGAFEFIGTMGANLQFEESWLEASLSYNYRDEEIVDQLIMYLEGGLKTVPGTKFGAYGRYYQSLGDMDEAPDFDPRNTIVQNDLFQLGVLFDIYFFDNFYSRFEYNVNLYGKNTYTGGTFFLRAGVIF